MKASKYKRNDLVSYRGDFGSGPKTTVTIISVDQKDGEVVYDLDNGRWCYESMIIEVLGSAEKDKEAQWAKDNDCYSEGLNESNKGTTD